MMSRNLIYILITALAFAGCSQSGGNPEALFRRMDNKEVGIEFVNKVENTPAFNIFNYRNFYNGGGVATGDVNNDGLVDVFFTSNMGSNKLYLNKGNWHFEDVTEKAGVADAKKWSTGVVMVDINNDKLLDIYVCNAGYQQGIGQENSLYINNGNGTFTDKAAEYGIADNGYTTHAAFFDYDVDGDLDVYILNNSFIPVNSLNNSSERNRRAEDWPVADFLKGGGDKLFRNDGTASQPKFTDVSEQAGIYGSLIGFGLGVTVGDVNNDALPDIYVSNDFFEKDYLYVNNGDGTFKEDLESRMPHISLSSMGADMADINNDGHPEVFVTDMLPRDETRLKTTTTYEGHYVLALKQRKGLYNQFMQNTLQLNNQDGTFSDIAYYSGVAASDWSWGALMFDADNDAQTDIYVCNGIYHDVIDQDFIDFFADEVSQRMAISGKKEQFDNILKHIPSVPIANIFFHNKGDLKFEEANNFFSSEDKSFSNGAAYADLDNDGDLDLVVNNVNEPCFVYQNQSRQQAEKNHYLKVKLTGESPNTYAIGAKVEIFANNQVFSKTVMPSRGFQSSTEYALTFGLGKTQRIDSLRIIWPNRRMTVVPSLRTDSTYSYASSSATKAFSPLVAHTTATYFAEQPSPFQKHVEEEYVDFFQEKNIPMLLSQEGPRAAVGDVNGDGQADIFIGGGANQAGQLYLQQDGQFKPHSIPAAAQHAQYEDTAATLFDADNDGDLDLYVGSGGNAFPAGDYRLNDRLYMNDGKANFTVSPFPLPAAGLNTAVVTPIDFDGDKDLDIFVGTRSIPMSYGQRPPSFLLENDGNGRFTDATAAKAPMLQTLGMVRDAQTADLNADNQPELIVVGDWMAPHILSFKSGKVETLNTGLADFGGFWGVVRVADLDNDRDLDLVLGNIGQNFSLNATTEGPLKLWVNDFDNNQLLDKIMTKTVDGKDSPVFLKREFMEQFPFLKSENLKHSEYAKRGISDLFKEDVLSKATVSQVSYLPSAVALNDGKGNFTLQALPSTIQFSCVNAIAVTDVNADGLSDILVAGNSYTMLPQLGRLDACRGNVLINKGKGEFAVQWPATQTGFYVKGQAKQLALVPTAGKSLILALASGEQPQLFAPVK